MVLGEFEWIIWGQTTKKTNGDRESIYWQYTDKKEMQKYQAKLTFFKKKKKRTKQTNKQTNKQKKISQKI